MKTLRRYGEGGTEHKRLVRKLKAARQWGWRKALRGAAKAKK